MFWKNQISHSAVLLTNQHKSITENRIVCHEVKHLFDKNSIKFSIFKILLQNQSELGIFAMQMIAQNCLDKQNL